MSEIYMSEPDLCAGNGVCGLHSVCVQPSYRQQEQIQLRRDTTKAVQCYCLSGFVKHPELNECVPGVNNAVTPPELASSGSSFNYPISVQQQNVQSPPTIAGSDRAKKRYQQRVNSQTNQLKDKFRMMEMSVQQRRRFG